MRTRQILIYFFIIGIFISSMQAQLRMKRVYFLQSGQYTGSNGVPVCVDSDHNGLNEIIFRTGTIYPSNPLRWEVWEYRPVNRYELVFADTGAYPYPSGITTGNFRPYDVGDIDRDSLTDLVGPNIDKVLNQDIEYNVVTTQESPNFSYYPESLSWSYRYANNMAASQPYYFTNDLDNDGRNEIITATPTSQIATGIWENVANNQNELVWHRIVGACSFAFGDFDQDSRKEFATADLGSAGVVSVYENTGPDQYELTYQDAVYIANGSDVFSGDVDGDGRPEFFVAFANAVSDIFYLYMWKATGNNTYQRTLVDQIQYGVSTTTGRRSKCGDIDGDGRDEIVWATPTRLYVYKATGSNQFQQVWQWIQDHGTDETLIANVFDMNNDGYKEIVVGGSGKTSIFEVEAVRILGPNGGEVFQGDSQQLIRWQTFRPPRCDSMSLFYSTDNGSTYAMITHGISGNDTSYLWTVPNVNSDSCKVKIIAYGPGWQYDESDGIFSITSTGIKEIALLPLAMTLGVKVYPNPAKSVIRVACPFNVKEIKIFDVSGKLIKEIAASASQTHNDNVVKISLEGIKDGIYFVRLGQETKKIVVNK